MTTYYLSPKSNYYIEEGKYFKNATELKDEKDQPFTDVLFKSAIRKENSAFIHRAYSNIIVLIGAGASVRCEGGSIDDRFGKTVFMLAKKINEALKQNASLFTLQELANFCKYSVPVELEDGQGLNREFNLEVFLSDLIAFKKYVPQENADKYEASENEIFKLIIANTSYEYDRKYLKHATFINTVSHLVKSPSKLTIVTTNYDTLIEDAADEI